MLVGLGPLRCPCSTEDVVDDVDGRASSAVSASVSWRIAASLVVMHLSCTRSRPAAHVGVAGAVHHEVQHGALAVVGLTGVTSPVTIRMDLCYADDRSEVAKPPPTPCAIHSPWS